MKQFWQLSLHTCALLFFLPKKKGEYNASYSNNVSNIKMLVATKTKDLIVWHKQTYPALNMIGGRRYMKKSSSLNTRMWDLFPSVVNRIIIPVQRPCNHPQKMITKQGKKKYFPIIKPPPPQWRTLTIINPNLT